MSGSGRLPGGWQGHCQRAFGPAPKNQTRLVRPTLPSACCCHSFTLKAVLPPVTTFSTLPDIPLQTFIETTRTKLRHISSHSVLVLTLQSFVVISASPISTSSLHTSTMSVEITPSKQVRARLYTPAGQPQRLINGTGSNFCRLLLPLSHSIWSLQ